jgi:mannose-6-phosphate isomerase-like protein (cupin superfamily)
MESKLQHAVVWSCVLDDSLMASLLQCRVMKYRNLSKLDSQSTTHESAVLKKVFIQNGEVPHLTNFSQAIFKPGDSVPPHVHQDMYEIFLVEAGTGEIMINGKRQDLAPGVCVLVEPTETHSLTCTGTDNLVLTYFGIV